jgi:phosphate transport system substrate-binding protein
MAKMSWVISIFLAFLIISCSTQTNQSNPTSTSAYIENKGSDTMVNLALAWAEEYQSNHSEISVSVTGGGSGTGIAALINGTVDIANASRKIKTEELTSAQEKQGQVNEFVVARDAIAVIVHLQNPVDQLTIQQLSDIYSGKINNWQEVGGADLPIVRLSRETNSGTHVYFLEEVLRLGNSENKTLFSTDTLLLPSSEGITKELIYNEHAIGYDGLGYVTPEVKVLAVARDEQGPYVLPSAETVDQGLYPIARELYMYTSGSPTGAVKDYIDWLLTPDAQKIVTELGFIPIVEE